MLRKSCGFPVVSVKSAMQSAYFDVSETTGKRQLFLDMEPYNSVTLIQTTDYRGPWLVNVTIAIICYLELTFF